MEDEIRKRIKWAIDRVCADERLTNITLAKALRSTPTTISNYRTMKTTPKAGFFVKFVERFKYDDRWLLYGEGEPFPGACQKYPEACGKDVKYDNAGPESSQRRENAVTTAAPTYGRGIDAAIQAMGDVRDIFDSKDPVFVPVIQANIGALKKVLQLERQIMQAEEASNLLKERVGKLEKLCAGMKDKLDAFESDNKSLRFELKKIQSKS